MTRIGVAVMGAGNLDAATAIVGSLATYFGERPLDIAFYDPDPERLELFTRLGKVCFTFTKATHLLWSTEEPAEALSIAERAVVSLDANGISRLIGNTDGIDVASLSVEEAHAAALPMILEGLTETTSVLSLLPETVRIPVRTYFRLDWPAPMSQEELVWLPHQINRWIRGDEYMFDLIRSHERSPLKTWLDDVNAATLVREL